MRASIAALSALIATAALAGPTIDPPVPSGRDPGGVAVAIIGPGLDYREGGISQRLARDGEGEIIGYDFQDDDRRPYKVLHIYETENFSHPGTAAARILLTESDACRLVAIRTSFNDPTAIAKAISYAAASPARIIAVQHPFAQDTDIGVLNAAAGRYPEQLFIVPAGDFNSNLDHAANIKGSEPNLIVVAAARADGSIYDESSWGERSVDVATEAGALTSFGAAGPLFSFKPDGDIAMARLAALAARLLAIRPDLSANELKTHVLRLARQPSARNGKATRMGFIAEPWRPFQVEKRWR